MVFQRPKDSKWVRTREMPCLLKQTRAWVLSSERGSHWLVVNPRGVLTLLASPPKGRSIPELVSPLNNTHLLLCNAEWKPTQLHGCFLCVR